MVSKANEPDQQTGFGLNRLNSRKSREIEQEAEYHRDVALLASELLKQNTPEQLATIAAQHIIYMDVLEGTLSALKEENILLKIESAMKFSPDQASKIAVKAAVDVRNGYARYRAAQSAIASHANRPKTKEKQFVLERWKEWRAQPNKYRGKAAFAKDMLTKCEHLESQKVIEDWCRVWEKSEPC